MLRQRKRQRRSTSLGQTIERFIHPSSLPHLWLLAVAGIVGFVGNEVAAQVQMRAGPDPKKDEAGSVQDKSGDGGIRVCPVNPARINAASST
jgi:hypothetical protein